MKRKLFAFLALPLLAVAALGCNGADCVSLCRESSARGCLFYDLSTGSCEGDCDLADSLAARSGCEAEWNDYLACEAAQVDICETGCNGESNRAGDCVTAYCLANLDDELCRRAAAGL